MAARLSWPRPRAPPSCRPSPCAGRWKPPWRPPSARSAPKCRVENAGWVSRRWCALPRTTHLPPPRHVRRARRVRLGHCAPEPLRKRLALVHIRVGRRQHRHSVGGPHVDDWRCACFLAPFLGSSGRASIVFCSNMPTEVRETALAVAVSARSCVFSQDQMFTSFRIILTYTSLSRALCMSLLFCA